MKTFMGSQVPNTPGVLLRCSGCGIAVLLEKSDKVKVDNGWHYVNCPTCDAQIYFPRMNPAPDSGSGGCSGGGCGGCKDKPH